MSNRRFALYTLCLFEAFPSRGSEKYGEEKQRVIYFMYHSAVSPFGGERSEPITSMLIMPYDTESQSRNALASPLGEEGHEVAKGCTRVRMIMILDVDVTAERRHYNTHRPIGRYHHHPLNLLNLLNPLNPGRRAP